MKCVHQSMFISVCFASTYFLCIFFFLPSNLQYTSIISIRTKRGRIHLNKTNFAAIIEKIRDFFPRILQCDKLQSSNDLDRARIPNTVPAVTGTTYTEKKYVYFIRLVFFIIILFCFCSFQLSFKFELYIKTKNVYKPKTY